MRSVYFLFEHVCSLKGQADWVDFNTLDCIKELFSGRELSRLKNLEEWGALNENVSPATLVAFFEKLLSSKIIKHFRYSAIVADLKKHTDFKEAIDEKLLASITNRGLLQFSQEEVEEKSRLLSLKGYNIGGYLAALLADIPEANRFKMASVVSRRKNNLIYLLELCEESQLNSIQKYFIKHMLLKQMGAEEFRKLLSKEILDITGFVAILNKNFLETRVTIKKLDKELEDALSSLDLNRDIKGKRISNIKAYLASTIGYSGRTAAFFIKTTFSYGDTLYTSKLYCE